MKNKPLLIAIIYSLTYILAFSFCFYGHYERWLNTVIVCGLGGIFVLTILTIKIQRDTVYGGYISGREGIKEGMKFAFYSFILLAVYHVVIYYNGYRDFRMDLIRQEEELLNAQRAAGTLKHSAAEIAKYIQSKKDFESLFSTVTGVLLKTIIVGFFSSFIAALFLKRAAPGQA